LLISQTFAIATNPVGLGLLLNLAKGFESFFRKPRLPNSGPNPKRVGTLTNAALGWGTPVEFFTSSF